MLTVDVAPGLPTAAPREGRSALLQIPELREIARVVPATWHSSPPVLEGRRWHRVRYARSVLLTPLDDAGHPPLLVSGRDISLGGFSFAHADPLPCRRASVTFFLDREETVTAELRLTWCRFTREAVYHSGGTFVRPGSGSS